MSASIVRRNVFVGMAAALLLTWGYLFAFSHIGARSTSLPGIALPNVSKVGLSTSSHLDRAASTKGQQIVLPDRSVAEMPGSDEATKPPASQDIPARNFPEVPVSKPPTNVPGIPSLAPPALSRPAILPPITVPGIRPTPPVGIPLPPILGNHLPTGGTLTPRVGVNPGS